MIKEKFPQKPSMSIANTIPAIQAPPARGILLKRLFGIYFINTKVINANHAKIISAIKNNAEISDPRNKSVIHFIIIKVDVIPKLKAESALHN